MSHFNRSKLAIIAILGGALLLAGTPAFAGNGNGRGNGKSKAKVTRTVVKRGNGKVVTKRTTVRSRRGRRTTVTTTRRVAPRRTVVTTRRPVRRTTTVVHRRVPPRRAVVVHHRRPARRVVVHEHRPAPRAVVVHREASPRHEPSVRPYIGLGVNSFSPMVSGQLAMDPTAGLGVHGGLLFDDRIALELGWVGTGNEFGDSFQAGTFDVKGFLGDGSFRPYLQAGLGAFAIDSPKSGSLAGPGFQLGGGLQLGGNGPLAVNVGATWQAMALERVSDLPSASQEVNLSGLTAGAAITARF